MFRIVLLIFILCACATLRSGHYVQLSDVLTLEQISKEFKVSKQHLYDENPGNRFQNGSWVFVPLKRGVIGHKTYERRLNYDGEMLWPVPASKSVSSNFGKRWGKNHEGIDIPAKRGSSILSVDDGVVVYSGNKFGGYGNVTVISHRGGIFTIYAHVQKLYVTKGQKVARGQVIATVGSTGKSTGPHLHFEVRKNSKAINPKRFLSYSK